MSIIAEKFDAAAKFVHAAGCLFITRTGQGASSRYETIFRSRYSVYALFIVGGSIIYEILLLHSKLAGEGYKRSFTNTVFNTLLTLIAIRIAASLSIIVFFSRNLASVLNHAQDFDLSLRHKFGARKHSRNLVSLICRVLLILFLAVFTFTRYFFFAELTSDLPPSIAKMATSAFVLPSTLFLSTACHIVYVIAAIIYDVFTDDLKHLVGVARVRLSHQTMLYSPRTARVLEDVRLGYLAMRKIVQELNDVLQYSTFVSFTCTLLTLCTCAYLISETDSSWGKLVFTTSYAVAISVELLGITLSVSQLKDQALQLSLLLDEPPISQLPKAVVQQVMLFQESLDIQLFCISGLGFFTVDKPILVSTAACVMSYTILLVQTGDGYRSKQEIMP